MCGIFGAIGPAAQKMKEPFFKKLFHRGPDGHGFYLDSSASVGLGHTRLSIIDLSQKATQPMVSSDQRYVLTFNGEIYNFREIKQELLKKGLSFFSESDSEVVLNSYIVWGKECVKKFRGMFAFAIYDKQDRSLFLARDRFGIKTLLYTFQQNQFLFSSELSPLKEFIGGLQKNHQAIDSYFLFGAIDQPQTFYKEIYHLPLGSFMQVKNNGSHQITRYYDLVTASQNKQKITDYSEAIHQTRSYLEEATRYHTVADVEVGAFLSGGVDSTAAVALMTKQTGKPVHTFSVGFKNQTEVIDELSVAKNTAQVLGTKHTEVIIDDHHIDQNFDSFVESLDQPSVDGINTFLVSQAASKKVKVALSGLGGDEIFAGYPHFQLAQLAQKNSPNFFSKAISRLHQLRPNRYTIRQALCGLKPEQVVAFVRSHGRFIQEFDDLNLSCLQRVSKFEIENYLVNTLLRDGDVLSMAHSLEVRPVLLDHPLVEFAFGLPDDFKIRGSQLKAILIDAVKDLIPKEVWNRPKTGFEMPFVSWMNGVLHERVVEAARYAQEFDFFEGKKSKAFIKRASKRKLVRGDWRYFIFFYWLLKEKIN